MPAATINTTLQRLIPQPKHPLHALVPGVVYADSAVPTALLLPAADGVTLAAALARLLDEGDSAFHQPEWKNARRTLGIMGVTLGVCFLGLSYLATHVRPSPYVSGSPTVISQIGKAVFGTSPVGHGLYFFIYCQRVPNRMTQDLLAFLRQKGLVHSLATYRGHIYRWGHHAQRSNATLQGPVIG